MRIRKNFLVLIFDCDGVLVDSEPIAARVLAGHLTALGYPLTTDDCIARFTGVSLKSVVEQVEADWGRSLPADFRSTLAAEDQAAFRAELRAIPGALDVIPRLAERRCVASSGSIEKMRLTLGVTGLWSLFDPHVFSAEAVARGKPAPDLFLFAADQMAADPVHCLVIEDSVAGVRAAVAAGMRTIGFVGGGHVKKHLSQELMASGAAVVVNTYDALQAVIEDRFVAR